MLRNLRRIRESKFLTQEQLAAKSGVSRGTIARIELGGDARITTVPKLAKALEVEPAQLVGEGQ